MIPEYRLINHLLLLKSNYFFKREIRRKIGYLPAKDYRDTYNLVFNCNKNLMFMKVISTYLEFNNITYKSYTALVANFILTITTLLPIFTKQIKKIDDYTLAKKTLLAIGCQDKINEWYNETIDEQVIPELLFTKVKNKKLNLVPIKKAVHLSGKMFAFLNQTLTNKYDHYQFGCYLMLFYVLDLETRQTLILKDNTTLNLKAFFSYENLFTTKLQVLDQLINSSMILEKNNFNLYIRIMNYSLLGNY